MQRKYSPTYDEGAHLIINRWIEHLCARIYIQKVNRYLATMLHKLISVLTHKVEILNRGIVKIFLNG